MANRNSIKWDDEKDDALQTFFDNDYTDEEIADYFGFKNEYHIKKRRYELGLLRRPVQGGHYKWSEEQLQYLQDTMHLKAIEVAEYLGKTKTAVEQKRSELGLKSVSRRMWQPWQIQLLKDYYPTRGPRYIEAKTGWDRRAIWAKASQLGVERIKR